MKKNKLIISIGLMMATVGASAQTLSTEITVDRTITAELPQASPLGDVWPALAEFSRPSRALEGTDYGITASFDPSVAYDHPMLFGRLNRYDGRKGYLWAGYFPAYNLGAAAGYRFVDTESTKAGAALNFNGLSYNNALTSKDLDRGVSSNIFGAQIYASHRFNGQASLRFNANYSYAGLSSPFGALYTYTQKQGINRARVELALDRFNAEGVSYAGAIKFRHLGLGKDYQGFMTNESTAEIYPGASETYFDAQAGLRATMSEHAAVRVDFAAEFLHSNGLTCTDFLFTTPEHSTSGIISLDPALEFSHEKFDFRLGAHLDLALSTPGRIFHVAPDVAAVWHPVKRAAVYAELGGGQEFNTLEELYNYSPFAPSFIVNAPRYSPIDARAGIRLGNFAGLSADIHAGYASVHDLPVMTDYRSLIPGAPVFAPVNLHGWYAGLDLRYSYGKLIESSASLHVYPHNYSSGNSAAPDRAKAVFQMKILGHVTDRLDVEASYLLRACRRYFAVDSFTGEHAAVDMRNISNLSLGANYALSSTFDVFLRLDNLLGRKAAILPGLAAQGFHGLAGISLRF